MNGNLKMLVGFLLLFALYHAAEYFVLFKYDPGAFLAVQVGFFIAAWLIARWQKFKGLSAWGLDRNRPFLKHVAIGMIMGVVLYALPYTQLSYTEKGAVGEVTIQVPTATEMNKVVSATVVKH